MTLLDRGANPTRPVEIAGAKLRPLGVVLGAMRRLRRPIEPTADGFVLVDCSEQPEPCEFDLIVRHEAEEGPWTRQKPSAAWLVKELLQRLKPGGFEMALPPQHWWSGKRSTSLQILTDQLFLLQRSTQVQKLWESPAFAPFRDCRRYLI